MSPQEKIYNQRDLIKLVIEHEYIPHSSQANFGQVIDALKEINPKAIYNTNCSGCIMEIMRIASIHLKAYEAQLEIQTRELRPGTEFYTFPQHPIEKRKPGRPRK